MQARLCAAGALFLCLLVGPALAEVRTDIRYETYPVRGLTIADIWRDIARKGPHQPERGLYAQAEAQIRFGWQVRFTTTSASCRVQSAEVNLNVKIVLPRWADEGRGHPAMRAAWQEYIARVKRHEETHKRIALEAAHQIDRAILGAPVHRDCRGLERYIKVQTDQILRRERERQAHFDRTDPPIYLREARGGV
jgi:predicted secreted Zn-dependent protease